MTEPKMTAMRRTKRLIVQKQKANKTSNFKQKLYSLLFTNLNSREAKDILTGKRLNICHLKAPRGTTRTTRYD